ncbi:MAG TPA: DUF885 domain-containing protein, partial [Steroidobacteraceae bacterium]|nr:DUF885 domain-containing protein [Steroidobacteraceae bacterium]
RAFAVFIFIATSAHAADTNWIEQSNKHAEVMLDLLAKYAPESAASLGVEGHDADVFDLNPDLVARNVKDLDEAIAELQRRRASVQDVRVQQDIDILLTAARNQRETVLLNDQYMLPFFDLGRSVYSGFQNLLDPRVAKDRYPAALTRLQRYIGAEKGYQPITKLARDRYEEKASDPKKLGPWTVEAKQYLDNQSRYMDGIEALLKKSGLKGWQSDLKTLRKQFDAYGKWVRETVLPHARQTSQLPEPIYADNLKNYGVVANPRDLMREALGSFVLTRSQLESLAQDYAKEHELASSDYRNVIRELKKQTIPNDRLLDLYTARLAEIEKIVQREHIVSLPTRKAVIRLGTEAESAAIPAPHIDPPRLIGNQGEPAEFVLPTSNPNASGAPMDDFNYDGITWTLTAHEARPGHELQFATMLEHGVSIARVIFAFNSANVEGWALYAEGLMKQYLPIEGQIGSLQMRLMREARAFLDPMLNLGMIQPDAAKQFLMSEVVLSEPMAKQEVDRYTFDSPGQATAYFYGFNQLNALRMKVELAQAGKFDEQSYHDFVMSQGLLPFDLLDKAVMEQYVHGSTSK